MRPEKYNYLESSEKSTVLINEQSVFTYLLKLPLTINPDPWIGFLNNEENLRANKFLSLIDHNRYVHAQLFKKQVLSFHSGIAEEEIMIEHEAKYGKPYLKGFTSLHFNLAYRNDYALLGIAEKPIGIDIEKEIEIVNMGNFALNFFSDEERKWLLDEAKMDARKTNFFRLWTLKESFIKAIGKGISYNLQDFSVFMDDAMPKLILPEKNPSNYKLKELLAPIGYKSALCLCIDKEVNK
jgi:4'-phosphopantetheinyl transferase